MKRLAEEIYRKLRNTFRFLLANLDGFVPATDEVAWEQMEPLDQYMLARCAELVGKCRVSYDAFEFHRVYHALNEFCNSELSAFYLDVLKDRLYTLAPKDTRRLSAQTAIWKMTEALVRLIAPILSFTADEVWGYLPCVKNREKSVHIAHFPDAVELAPILSQQVLIDFMHLRNARETGLKILEFARVEKHIGKSLEAKLVFNLSTNEAVTPFGGTLPKYESALPELFGVSQVELRPIRTVGATTGHSVDFTKADGTKCARCWRYTMDVGAAGMYPEVCARCADALEKIGYPPVVQARQEEQPA